MLKAALVTMMLLVMIPFSFAGSPSVKSEHRSAAGKLLYTTTTKGNQTEARSPSGKLLWKSKTVGEKTEVRSPSGKLIEWFRSR
jgi:hypothetical protein